jgi:hypothetical protein
MYQTSIPCFLASFNILSRSALGKLSSQSLVLLKEKVTNDYGLWQSCTAVDGILRSITKQTEKRKTLIAQLRFRQCIKAACER